MRSDRVVPLLAISYYVAMLVFLTFPGYVPFSRVRPFVLGMPFALFWQVLWVSGAVAVLGGLFLWESRRTAASGGRGGGSGDASLPGSGAGLDPSSRTRGRVPGDIGASESGGESSTTEPGLE